MYYKELSYLIFCYILYLISTLEFTNNHYNEATFTYVNYEYLPINASINYTIKAFTGVFKTHNHMECIIDKDVIPCNDVYNMLKDSNISTSGFCNTNTDYLCNYYSTKYISKYTYDVQFKIDQHIYFNVNVNVNANVNNVTFSKHREHISNNYNEILDIISKKYVNVYYHNGDDRGNYFIDFSNIKNFEQYCRHDIKYNLIPYDSNNFILYNLYMCVLYSIFISIIYIGFVFIMFAIDGEIYFDIFLWIITFIYWFIYEVIKEKLIKYNYHINENFEYVKSHLHNENTTKCVFDEKNYSFHSDTYTYSHLVENRDYYNDIKSRYYYYNISCMIFIITFLLYKLKY
jgi:hypothetical protein